MRPSKFSQEEIAQIIAIYEQTRSQSETCKMLYKYFNIDINPGLVTYYVTEYAEFEKETRNYAPRKKKTNVKGPSRKK